MAFCLAACSLPIRERDELDALDPTGGVRFPVPALRSLEVEDRSVDVLHVRLNLDLDPEQRTIDGEATYDLVIREHGVDRFELDLTDLEVKQVSGAAGQNLFYQHREGRLLIELGAAFPIGSAFQLHVRYGGSPRTGMYFRRDGAGRHQVFTHNQPEQARAWFPCVDAPDERQSFELHIAVPYGMEVTAGGRLVAREIDGKRERFHWQHDFALPSYLVSFAAGHFAEIRVPDGDTDLVLYCEPEDLEPARLAFREASAIHEFFTRWTAMPLPWPEMAYTVVRGLPVGGMENLGHVLLDRERFLQDPALQAFEDPSDLLAHEAAHQWFGDLVSPRSWSDLWISEGLASYLHLLWVEEARGQESFRHWMRINRADARRNEAERGPRSLHAAECVHPLELFDARVYGGAAARLHLLRDQIGAEAFRTGCQRYLQEHAGRSVTTSELLQAFQSSTQEDLSAFFAAWFDRGGEPEFDVRWKPQGSGAVVQLEQVPSARTGEAAIYPLDLEVVLGDQSGARHRSRLAVRTAQASFDVHCGFKPSWLVIDPEEQALCRVRTPTPVAALQMLLNAPEPSLQHAAIREMQSRLRDPNETQLATLQPEVEALLDRGAVRALRVDALDVYQRLAGNGAMERMRGELGDQDPRVRAAAAHALGAMEPEFTIALSLRRAWENEANPGVRAALLEALGIQRAAGLLGVIDLVLDDPTRTSVERRAALQSLEALSASTRRSAPEILDRIEPSLREGRSVRERAAAIMAYERASRGDLHSRARIERALRDPSLHVRRAAAAALERRGDPAALMGLIAAYRAEREASVRIALIHAGRALNAFVDAAAERLQN